MNAGDFDQKIRIQRKVADTSFDGAGSETWELLAEVWANIQDKLPSRGEKLADGLTIATRPSRVRIHYRTDVTAAMRILVGGTVNGVWQTERTAEIVTPPAEVTEDGRRRYIEFMVEDYSTSGNA